MRRLEALKIARQKRIAAKSSSNAAQSSLPALQTRKILPTKLSPSAHKTSKFSDSEPGPSSPLQRFSIKTPPVRSADSNKASKASKLNTGTNSTGNRPTHTAASLPGNRLTHSASSLPGKKENNSTTTDSKVVSMARIRRLSEPKMSINSPHVSTSKPRRTEAPTKPKVSDGSEIKNISEIMNYDKGKVASLPELKVRKSKGPVQKVTEAKASTITKSNRNKDKAFDHSDGDDNLVIEKSVVVQECEKPSISAANTREGKTDIQKEYRVNHQIVEENEVSEYAAIRAPASPATVPRDKKEPIGDQFLEQPTVFEVKSVRTP